MLHYPEIQARVHEEIDKVTNLAYLEYRIKQLIFNIFHLYLLDPSAKNS